MSNPRASLGLPTRTGTLTPHQRLAAAVIRQAIADASDPRCPASVRATADRFLAGSVMLHDWCAVAGLDPALLLEIGWGHPESPTRAE